MRVCACGILTRIACAHYLTMCMYALSVAHLLQPQELFTWCYISQSNLHKSLGSCVALFLDTWYPSHFKWLAKNDRVRIKWSQQWPLCDVLDWELDYNFEPVVQYIDRDKMATFFPEDILKWIFLNEDIFKFHWNLILRVQLIIFQHWFR